MPQYVRQEGGRDVADKRALDQAAADGTCPFCEIIAGQRPDQPVIIESPYWAGFLNIQPEPYTELHLTVAAKLPSGHSPALSFSDLSEPALQAFGPMVREVHDKFVANHRGYSVFMRVGRDGDDTAASVRHPCWHLVVSDGRPISREDISPILKSLLVRFKKEILEAFLVGNPELYGYLQARRPDDLWDEALKFLWTNVGLLRSFLNGKAGEIRPKFSNLAHL